MNKEISEREKQTVSELRADFDARREARRPLELNWRCGP